MNCCVKCFKDKEIIDIIKGKEKGKCDFCNNDNVYICKIEENKNLKDSFESLLDVYTPVAGIEKPYPREAELMKNVLSLHWNIFNLDAMQIYDFLIKLFPEKYKEQPELFDAPVWIADSVNKEYMKVYSILGNYQWEDFVGEIKNKNRFHTNIINKNILKTIIEGMKKTYKKGHEFYRARIWDDRHIHGFEKKEMGAPPVDKATAGRVNSEGISCLYLADSKQTTYHEIRAGVYDDITIAKYKLKKDVKVVNLATIDKISPFSDIDSSLLAINLPNLKKIGDEISKPLRRQDSSLDYLPTQYISDYIKSIGFDGIEYKSAMHRDGRNIAFFDEESLKCMNIESYRISELTYKPAPIHDE